MRFIQIVKEALGPMGAWHVAKTPGVWPVDDCHFFRVRRRRIAYQRPILVKARRMTFPIQIIEASGRRVVCRQCSSCHGCR